MQRNLKIFKALKTILYYTNKDMHENEMMYEMSMIKFKEDIGMFYVKFKLCTQG